MAFLKTRTNDEHARISADYQQNGLHMKAKRLPSKVMYKFFKGISVEFSRLEGYLNSVTDGMLVTSSTDFVPEWENAVGIPDDSFPANGTADERQRHIVTKLASEGVSTASEFEWLCSLMGFSVTVYPGHYFWLNPDPRVTFDNVRESRFTIVFETDFFLSEPEVKANLFPVPFPWQFTSNNYNIMQEFLLSIIPANCNGLFITKENIGGVIKDEIGESEVWKDFIDSDEVYKDDISVS